MVNLFSFRESPLAPCPRDGRANAYVLGGGFGGRGNCSVLVRRMPRTPLWMEDGSCLGRNPAPVSSTRTCFRGYDGGMWLCSPRDSPRSLNRCPALRGICSDLMRPQARELLAAASAPSSQPSPRGLRGVSKPPIRHSRASGDSCCAGTVPHPSPAPHAFTAVSHQFDIQK